MHKSLKKIENLGTTKFAGKQSVDSVFVKRLFMSKKMKTALLYKTLVGVEQKLSVVTKHVKTKILNILTESFDQTQEHLDLKTMLSFHDIIVGSSRMHTN